MSLSLLLRDIKKKENKNKAKILSRFFKTGQGQYGFGDLFLGITVPELRKIAIKYKDLGLSDLSKLIQNKYHEARLIALLILVHNYKNASKSDTKEKECKKIVDFYLKNTKCINNWDLVDLSAHYILGDYLTTIKKDMAEKILEKLARSKNMWERRIAVISTFAFIYKEEPELTLRIVKMLINDENDLIQKACGWMLREVGKRVSEEKLTSFLDIYIYKIPRTTLRYAIERLPEKKRLCYLHK